MATTFQIFEPVKPLTTLTPNFAAASGLFDLFGSTVRTPGSHRPRYVTANALVALIDRVVALSQDGC